jgi:hypothetical protein
MFDLRVGSADRPSHAIEVTAAIDELFTKTWNTGPAKGPMSPGIPDDWMIEIRPGTDIKRLHRDLPRVLVAIAALGAKQVVVDVMLKHGSPELFRQLDGLGVAHVHRTPSLEPGKIHFTMPGQGGAIDSNGAHLPEWIEKFLRDARRADVLRKLGATPARHREVFVWVTLTGAPWSVVSYLTDLTRTEFSLPTRVPDLPNPLTGVWLAATLRFGDPIGVYWNGTEWQAFNTNDDVQVVPHKSDVVKEHGLRSP